MKFGMNVMPLEATPASYFLISYDRNEAGTRSNTPAVIQSHWLHPVFVTKVALWSQQCWRKPHFSWSEILKVQDHSGNFGIDEDNIKMDHNEIRCEGVEWIQLAQDRVQWQAVCKHGNEPSDKIYVLHYITLDKT
jgi:hypothetical protein